MARVLIAARSEIERAGLESLVTSSSHTVVGAAADAGALAEQIDSLRPDVVLVTLELDDDVPVQALVGPHAALVALVDDPGGAWAAEAVRSGARGVLPRNATAAEIAAAVEAAAAGLVVLHADALDGLLPAPLAPAQPLSSRSERELTPREVEVLGMLAQGLGNKEIAWRLKISEHTVKFHISSIFTKLDASSRTEAVTRGIRRGIIML